MPETPASSDAERPIGRFITENVLPAWDEMNSYETVRPHSSAVASALLRGRVRTHRFSGKWTVYLYNGRVAGGQFGRLSTLVSAQALEACSSKWLARQYIAATDLPAPKGFSFSTEQQHEAASLLRANRDRDWVLRPDTARHGRGVSFRVTPTTLPEAWQRMSAVRPAAEIPEHAALLDPFHDALPLRLFVVGDHVIAAVVRVPLFVVGDGISTVQQLIHASFAHRERHALLHRVLPEISEELLRPDAPGLETVPPAGALHVLSEDGGLTAAGLPYDVTNVVSEELKRVAVSAVEAVPGLGVAGVDLMTPRLDSADEAVVLDIDAWASLVLHSAPAFGRRRPVAPAIAELIRLRAEHWERVTLPAAMAPSAGSGEDD